jgi:PKD repeat protein
MEATSKKIIISILATFVLYINANAISDALKIKIINGSTSDETVIRFLPTATQGFDGSYDAYKMFSSSTVVPAIFTKIGTISNLSINALPSPTALTSTELYTHIKVAGTYTIQAIELGTGFPADFKLVLEDKETGDFYNFRNGSVITLPMTVNTLTNCNRFTIHVSPPTLLTFTNVTCSGLNNGSISVTKSGNHNWDYVLTDSNAITVDNGANIDESLTITNLNPGTYTLYTSSSTSLSDTNSITISEPVAIVAEFFSNQDQAYLSSAEFTFTNNSSNAALYSWDFGDGTISSDSSNATHEYLTVGTFIVTLTAINTSGCSASFSKIITVNEDLLPMEIVLTNVTCNGMNNGMMELSKPENHSWNYELLDSNSVIVASGNNIDESIIVSNLNAGIYTLYTNSILTSPDTNSIVITQPEAVIAEFSSNYDQVYLSAAEVTFTNSSTNATTYSWDFGDGSLSSDSAITTHQYLSTGNFTVTLIALSPEGCSASFSKTITVDADLSTGIADAGSVEHLIAYQQNGALQLSINSGVTNNISINVYNNLGQSIYTYSGKSDMLRESVQLQNNGVYIINSVIGNKVQSQKISFTK